jgi:ribonuclease J
MKESLTDYIRGYKDDEITDRFPIPDNKGITAIPVGGLGRIGMNWTLYGFDGKWILVDAGIGFLVENIEGVDAYIPDPLVFEDIKNKIDALVITHAHEDHIGAIDRVFPDILNLPIYCTPFTEGILRRRFEERGVMEDITINTFYPGDDFKIGKFSIETVELTHSVPEPVGLAIKAGDVKIFHTGDWKIDDCPVVGNGFDWNKLEKVANSGITALLCDSTNAHKPLEKTSESDVREAFQHVFEESNGMVVVACFGTNIARMTSAIHAAGESGRKVGLAGYSLRNNYKLAEDLKLVKPTRYVMDHISHLKGLDRREMAIVCSGVQGEKNASLYKMLKRDNNNKLIDLMPGDTVIMSSRVIPGNEENVEELIKIMKSERINVLTVDDKINNYPIHVSGHAGSIEIEELHDIINPKFTIPVHGDEKHLDAHAKLSKAEAIRGGEGTIFHITSENVNKMGRIFINIVPLTSDVNGNRLPYIIEEDYTPTFGQP